VVERTFRECIILKAIGAAVYFVEFGGLVTGQEHEWDSKTQEVVSGLKQLDRRLNELERSRPRRGVWPLVTTALFAMLAMGAAAASLYLSMRPSQFPGTSLDNYDMSSPAEAYKSTIDMLLNADMRAITEINSQLYATEHREKRDSLAIEREISSNGHKGLLIRYMKDGIERKEVVWMERDSSSGMWTEGYLSISDIDDHEIIEIVDRWEPGELP